LKGISQNFCLIDIIEQPIPRLVDKNRRKMFYSGKKRRYTVKSQLMANDSGGIIYKANHKKGRRHNYDIYKENHPIIPKQVVTVADLGYYGIEKDFPVPIGTTMQKKRTNYYQIKKRL
jgi:hypothetical protein